jgi:hypothetical protein
MLVCKKQGSKINYNSSPTPKINLTPATQIHSHGEPPATGIHNGKPKL